MSILFCEIYYTLSSKIYSEQLLDEINENLENHGGNPPKEKVIKILFRKRTFFTQKNKATIFMQIRGFIYVKTHAKIYVRITTVL